MGCLLSSSRCLFLACTDNIVEAILEATAPELAESVQVTSARLRKSWNVLPMALALVDSVPDDKVAVASLPCVAISSTASIIPTRTVSAALVLGDAIAA
mmetsp:Transcript_40142/g.82252  ORF Transcript_40142/g.82252 Transcript_40142/m.82252 type:complete len:99 (+) Transcript_40142:315-611(+)